MTYVDGFVIPIPRKKVEEYREMARKAGEVWMEYGALEFRECLGDDLNVKDPDGNSVTPFPDMVDLADDETVMFSWIVYESRAARDRINEKVLADPRIEETMEGDPPFDMKRMAYGGFQPIVEFSAERDVSAEA